MIPGSALSWLAAALYGLASLLYVGFLAGLPPAVSRAARAALLAGLVVHTAEISRRGFEGVHPAGSTGEAIGFLSWIVVAVFLLAQLRRPLDAVGSLIAPGALMMLVIAYLAPTTGAASTADLGVLGRVHIVLAILGASSFAFATALAVLYLIEERQLKRHKIGLAVRRGTALETLDRLMHRTAQLGFPIFTVAMITGVVWTGQRTTGMRLEYSLAAVAWAAFASLLVARHTAGWRGRRAALLTIIGFAATAAVLGLYLTRGGGAS